MKFVSILLACLAAVSLAAPDPKECEGEQSYSHKGDKITFVSKVGSFLALPSCFIVFFFFRQYFQ